MQELKGVKLKRRRKRRREEENKKEKFKGKLYIGWEKCCIIIC